MAPEGYHEPYDELSTPTRDLHRALLSLEEELEAIDWYRQRADACDDEDLRAILVHNLNEEVEHASMLLEWIRKRHEVFDNNRGRRRSTTAFSAAVRGPTSSDSST